MIGKGRRVTLDELQAVALYDGILELHAPDVEGTPGGNDLSASLLSMSLEQEGLMSSSVTIAAITLLSLNVAQGKVVKKNTLNVTAALIDLVNSAKRSGHSICLPSDAQTFQSKLVELLPGEAGCVVRELGVDLVSRTLLLAVGSLATARATSLSRVSTAMGALSAERTKANSIAFAEFHFDVNRPHRGLVTAAATLRAILNGSKFVTAQTNLDEVPLAISNLPQYQGPSQDSLKIACKTLELENNCFEGYPGDVLDNTVAILALRQALDAVSTLLVGAESRMGIISPIRPIPVDTWSLGIALDDSVASLGKALQAEATMGTNFVQAETKMAEMERKEKEAQKAAKATSSEAKPVGGSEDEFTGMTEAQKAKILKKRHEKDAKMAAKMAAKETKGVNIFGDGTLLIIKIMTENNFELTETAIAQIETIIDKLLSGGVQRKPKIAKGTRDYLPEQMMIRQQAFDIIRRVFQSHGAVEIDTPVFELKDTLTGKYGEDSKLIYDLADQGGEMLALRYDLTVPFARFLALNSVGNIKRFHIGKVYRRDQPALARGRYREFYQCDFDIAGTYGRMVPDSECLCVACEILDALPIGDFGIKLNHRRLLDAILDLSGVPTDKFRTICSAVDKLDKEPWEEVKREMVEDKGLKPEVADKIGTFVLNKGAPWDLYNELIKGNKFGKHAGALGAMEDLRILFEYLDAMDKLKFFSFDLSLARGLDYYTGVIYEAVCMNGNTQVGSIGGGGRYDTLVSMFQEAGKVTPCVGVSVGIERVFTLMEERLRAQQGTIKQPNVNVLVASVGDGMMKERMKVTRLLWDAKIKAEFSQQENPKIKYELTDALDREIPFMVIVGEEEVRERKCKVKDLKAKTEETVGIDDLVSNLLSKGVIPAGCEFAAELSANNASKP